MALDNLNMKNLCTLLAPPDADSDSDLDEPKSGNAVLGPGDVGPPKKQQQEKTADVPKNTKDIWDPEEVQAGAEYEDIYDPRPPPEYEIVYKQAVTSEDMFLQMGNKTPATSSCEDMIVKIQLPGTNISDVELDVKDTFLDCRTTKFKLGLHLPHPVDSKNGKAEWNGDKTLLTVTMRMTRHMDFMNF